MQVYAQRTIGTDDYIGELKDTIEILFANGTTNGKFHPSAYRSIDPTLSIVVTRNLRKVDKKGKSQELPTVIEFTISSFASLDGATNAQMDEAVGQARDAISLVSNVLTTWEPLLEKVKLFTEIMDTFTEV
jgi:hypothetical protein